MGAARWETSRETLEILGQRSSIRQESRFKGVSTTGYLFTGRGNQEQLQPAGRARMLAGSTGNSTSQTTNDSFREDKQ